MPKLPVVVALDFDNEDAVYALTNRLSPELCRLKVGKELFTRTGPALVERLQRQGFEIFLDLKFHDIPTTVAKAVSAAADLGVWMVNVHASGGARMMNAAAEALDGRSHKPLLIAVTVLTSMNEQDLVALGHSESPAQRAKQLALMARDCGLDGVVCSAAEATELRQATDQGFALVTPGIRLAGDSADDQRRVMTPKDAVRAGADYLVIGRSITGASDPMAALARVEQDLVG